MSTYNVLSLRAHGVIFLEFSLVAFIDVQFILLIPLGLVAEFHLHAVHTSFVILAVIRVNLEFDSTDKEVGDGPSPLSPVVTFIVIVNVSTHIENVILNPGPVEVVGWLW